jgi:hypothetical protein
VTIFTIKRLDGLLELARANLPRAVESDGSFEDWRVVAPALVAICADLLEGIAGSVPPRARVRAEVLARSLAEYAIAFAWMAAAEKEEERAARMRSFVKDEFSERERAENKLKDQIRPREAYAHLFADAGQGGSLPSALLDDQTRERLEQLKKEQDLKAPPNAFDMAFEADRRWMPEIELVRSSPFAMVYFTLFVGPSFTSHPSVTSVAKMTLGTPPNLVVGAAEPLGVSEMPYGHAMVTLAGVLLIASRVLGWPDEEAVLNAVNRE